MSEAPDRPWKEIAEKIVWSGGWVGDSPRTSAEFAVERAIALAVETTQLHDQECLHNQPEECEADIAMRMLSLAERERS